MDILIGILKVWEHTNSFVISGFLFGTHQVKKTVLTLSQSLSQSLSAFVAKNVTSYARSLFCLLPLLLIDS